MRYIDNRETFIQRSISKKFEKTPYSEHNFPIYEEYSGGSGKAMFTNNIGWNDSLLGRLINHIIRKIKIKLASVVKIPRLINRLNAEFEKIHTNGLLSATYDADIKYKMEVIKLEVYSFIFELKKSISEGDDLSIIKNLAKSALESLEKADDELENKKEMIDELKKFLDFLESYKPVSKNSSGGNSTDDNGAFLDKYDLLVSNLTYLSKMLTQYKSIKTDVVSPVKKGVPVKESLIFDYQSFVDGLNESSNPATASVISKEQKHAFDAFSKLKVQFQNLDKTLKGSKDPIVSTEQLSKIISNKDSEVYKNFIIKLYVDIVKNLNGLNKTFIAPNSPLYENWNLRIDKLTTSEFSSISDKMSRFASVALKFKKAEEDGNSLYNEYNFDGIDLGKNLKGYVDTMSQIKSLKINKSKEDDNKDFDNSEIEKHFEENCKLVFSFKSDEKIVEELNVELKNIKVQRGFIIDGFDPIIEILRIFNQAYKIYMTPIISKRSQNLDGSAAGPSPGTLLEYTDMGSQGPWRNNKLFDQWEDAVYNILGERKYQVIFDKDTVLRVGDELREGKGPRLRQFMTDLLDGSKLYKPGGEGKGSQAKLLDEYFDTLPPDTPINTEPTGGSGTVTENTNMQTTINENSKEIQILKLNTPGAAYVPGAGTFFIIDGSDIDNNSKVQIFAHYISDDKIVFMRSFGPWSKFLDPIRITKNELVGMIGKPFAEGGNPYTIFYSKTNATRFKDDVQLNREMKITYTTEKNSSKSETLNIKVKEIYKICLKDGEDLKILDLSPKFKEEWSQKFQRLGVNFGFSVPNNNKIEKYTK